MSLRTVALWVRLSLVAILISFFAGAAPADEMRSPGGQIRAGFSAGSSGLSYSVIYKPRETVLINEARLGLEFLNQAPLSRLRIQKKSRRFVDSTYRLAVGKASLVRDRYNEYLFELEERSRLRRRLLIRFRLYDDGIAFRYELPKQKAFSEFAISEEKTEVAFAGDVRLYALPLGFGSSYEGLYKVGDLKEFESGQTLVLPLLAEVSGVWMAMTEAALVDYAGLYLTPSNLKSGTLEARLAPLPQNPLVKVRGKTPHRSPWRALMIGETAGRLIESNLVTNLNEPSVIKDTSWIRPGQVQFPWWNGYFMPGGETAPVPPGLNTWTLKRYIDFCALNGIPYHSLDGFESGPAWYGGPVTPYEGQDLTKAIPEIDLQEVLGYGKAKGVRMRIWLNWVGLEKNLDRILATYARWGVEGIMVDFVDRDDQDAVRFYENVLKAAAKYRLTVSFHGIFKPTGLSRTFPNLLNHEAVMGSEFLKWTDEGLPASHEVMIAYTRMLAGPMDTHQGSFRPVARKNFKAQSIAPNSIGTLARQMAMYVVYENYLPMLSDYPEAYGLHRDAFEFVRRVPSTWSETRFIAGEVGRFIALARRNDDEWFVGVITDADSRRLELPMDFLGAGRFVAKIYSDPIDLGPSQGIQIREVSITSKESLSVDVAADGGSVMVIRRQP